MVHLKNNKIWSTLHEKPQSHEEMVDRCEKHLVYLGFDIFLHLEKRSPPILVTMPILGTVLSHDPATKQELLHSVGMKIKPESAFTGTIPKLARLPKTSAAAGSATQLERVETEMKVEPSTDKSEVMPLPRTHPMVEMYPFEVHIRRLTPKEIEKYTVRSDQLPTNHSCTARPSLVTIRPSPVTTRSMTKRKISKGLKW